MARPRRGCHRSAIVVLTCAAFISLTMTVTDRAVAAEYTLDVLATNGGDRYWFQVDGYPGENPTLSFATGDHVTVQVLNGGTQAHNMNFGLPIDEGIDLLAPGESANLTFQVPNDGAPQRIPYWCDPHRRLGMTGELILGQEESAGGSAETPDQDTPFPSSGYLVLLVIAVAVSLRRRSAGRARLISHMRYDPMRMRRR